MNPFLIGSRMLKSNTGKKFDWDKAATILRERNVDYAKAGLLEDMFWTCGAILRDGKPIPADQVIAYLASTWATPVLVIGNEYIECYTEGNGPDDAVVYWPSSALEIFNSPGD